MYLTLDDLVLRSRSRKVWNRIVIVRKGIGQTLNVIAGAGATLCAPYVVDTPHTESQTFLILGMYAQGKQDKDGPFQFLEHVVRTCLDDTSLTSRKINGM